MADKYDLRVLVRTTKGREFSYYSSSFFNSDVDGNYALSASQVYNYNRYIQLKSCHQYCTIGKTYTNYK